MGGPLSGYKIVELAGIGPGPFAAMMLSDMGADVIRVDRAQAVVGFDPSKPPLDAMSRGRRSIAVDLKHPEGRQTVLELVRQADGLVEGFRPGVTERLGLGPDDCLAVNPKLVYGRMTGWGQDGPYAQSAGHDINYIALAGTLRAIGRGRRGPGAPAQPRRRLRRRRHVHGLRRRLRPARGAEERQGSGDRRGDGRRRRGPHHDVLGVPGDGHLQRRPRHEHARHRRPLLRRLRDRRQKYVSIGAIERQFYAELCERTGFETDQENPPFHMDPTTWPERKEKLAALIKTKTRDEWCAILEHTDACFAPVLSFEEAPNTRTTSTGRPSSKSSTSIQPAPAPRFSRTPPAIQRPPAHPGQHTAEILQEWLGMGDGSVKGLRSVGAIA